MANKIDLLANKVEEVVKHLEALNEENKSLKKDNRALTRELSKLRKEYEGFKLNSVDRKDTVRTKLTGILDRLDQLQSMAE